MTLLRAPFDSGHRGTRMGGGPEALARAGASERLRARGHLVTELVVEPSSSWVAEVATAFELNQAIAVAVAEAEEAGHVPLLLAGNCNATLGVLAGLADPAHRQGLVWLDAHGDFNTPEEDTGGFLDGHGLAIAVGRCWAALAATIPGFRPLPESHVLLIGARDLSEDQRAVLLRSGVTWLPPAEARDPATLVAALEQLSARVDVVHFHVDLDVHDPSIAPANGYAAPDGLSAAEVRRVLRLTAAQLPVVSGTLASYDPAYDVEHRMRDTALDLLDDLAAVATPAAPRGTQGWAATRASSSSSSGRSA
ncbi:arginase [Blastococcus colisei]|uniref:Arginase n=1 Tax=Blastococcus colisei TaxID=1564162 RepID=A0A543PGK0_9ACTN|nr:arginase [Blastococcus colisei]